MSDYDWPEVTAATLLAGLASTRKADEAQRLTDAIERERELLDRDSEWWADDDDDPTAYDLPMTGANYLRSGERRNLA